MSSRPGPTNLCGLDSCPWRSRSSWGLCQQGPRRSLGTWLGTERARRGGRRWPKSNHLGDGSARTSSEPGGMPPHPQGLLVLVVLSPGARCRLAPGCEYLGVRHTRPGAPCAARGCGGECRRAQKLKCFLVLTSTGRAEHFCQGCWKAHVLHAFKAGQVVAVQKPDRGGKSLRKGRMSCISQFSFSFTLFLAAFPWYCHILLSLFPSPLGGRGARQGLVPLPVRSSLITFSVPLSLGTQEGRYLECWHCFW